MVETVENLKFNVLPSSILIIGREGSGKHTLIEELNQKYFNNDYLDITDTLSFDLIEEIYRNPQKHLYIIDLNKVDFKKQNILLKLLEEPSSNIYIACLSNNEKMLLNTIKNRLFKIHIKEKSKEDLIEFAKNNNIDIEEKYFNKIIFTYGDILKIRDNNVDLDKIKEICDKIATKLNKASLSNTLTIVDKINFDDEYDKIDFNFFLRYLEYYLPLLYINNKEEKIFNMFKIFKKENNKIIDSRLNKKIFLYHMLEEMWRSVR